MVPANYTKKRKNLMGKFEINNCSLLFRKKLSSYRTNEMLTYDWIAQVDAGALYCLSTPNQYIVTESSS